MRTSPDRQPAQPEASPVPTGWLAPAAYAVLVIYASLYPATEWRLPGEAWWTGFFGALSGRWSRSDVISNVLAYIPLGLLLAWCIGARVRTLAVLVAVTLMGTALSLSVEIVQLFLPSRVASIGDLALNMGGTALGAWLGLAVQPGALPARLHFVARSWLAERPGANAGLAALALWMLSQWSPFVPSLDLATLRDGTSSLRETLRGAAPFRWHAAAQYALSLSGLGLIAALLIKPGRGLLLPYCTAAAVVLCVKTVIVGRGISLEALCGLAAAAAMLAPLQRLPEGARAACAIVSIAAGFAVAELAPGQGALHAFNWIPFAGAIENHLNGFANILEALWPFFALGFLAALLTPAYLRREVGVLGALAVAAIAGALEWGQLFIPGRHADITTVLLALAGWTAAWRHSARRAPELRS